MSERRLPAAIRLPRGRRGRIAAAAAAAGVVVAFLLVPGRGGPGVVDRALAAVGDRPILHLVTQAPSGTVTVDLKTGARTVGTMELELWSDRRFERVHALVSYDGRLLGDLLLPDDQPPGSARSEPLDPAFAAMWSGYRKALENGTATVERRDAVDGRPVYWLRFPPAEAGTPGTEVAVDAETYKPLVIRSSSPSGDAEETRILLAETVELADADFTRRGPDPTAGLSAGSASSGTSVPAGTVVPSPWLTPGDRVAGLRLTEVSRLTVTNEPAPGAKSETLDGIELVYGDRPRTGNGRTTPPLGPPPLHVEEVEQSRSAPSEVPPGSVAISTGSGGADLHRVWEGSLVRDGIEVTITTDRGEAAVLEVARALHRAP